MKKRTLCLNVFNSHVK